MSKVLVFTVTIRPVAASFTVAVYTGHNGELRYTSNHDTYEAAESYADGVYTGLRVAHGDCTIAMYDYAKPANVG